MVRIGIIGIGFMGKTHWAILNKIRGAKVVAVADVALDEVRKTLSKSAGNIDVADAALSLDDVTTYRAADQLIADADLDAVDICIPPWQHTEFTLKALRAGKHVFCEKPIAHNLPNARKALAGVEASDRIVVYGHCIRFWPEYVKAKELIQERTCGRVVAAYFYRYSPTPTWGWYSDPAGVACVGGVLDLHIHDADYVISLWGLPRALTATGQTRGLARGRAPLSTISVVYDYGDGPAVSAGAYWADAPTVSFEMGFDIVGEEATIRCRWPAKPSLQVHRRKGRPLTPKIANSDGWKEELKYFVQCVNSAHQPSIGTVRQAYDSLRVVGLTAKSAETARTVPVPPS